MNITHIASLPRILWFRGRGLDQGPCWRSHQTTVWGRLRSLHDGSPPEKLGLSLQKPRRRDYRQNPQHVAQWREETLPELKKTAAKENPLVFYVDESAFYLLPQVRRTWAPVGQTPILTEGCQYAHLSVIGAISNQGHLYYRLQESSYTGSAVAQFSRDLLGLTSHKLHIIWEGASIHRSQEVKDFLRTETQDGRVQLTLRPAYSPQLNTAEQVWAWFKGGELKNVCGKTLDELTQQVQQAFSKLTDKTELIRNFFTHPEVAFY